MSSTPRVRVVYDRGRASKGDCAIASLARRGARPESNVTFREAAAVRHPKLSQGVASPCSVSAVRLGSLPEIAGFVCNPICDALRIGRCGRQCLLSASRRSYRGSDPDTVGPGKCRRLSCIDAGSCRLPKNMRTHFTNCLSLSVLARDRRHHHHLLRRNPRHHLETLHLPHQTRSARMSDHPACHHPCPCPSYSA